MTQNGIPPGKYNPWCHRQGLWCTDESQRNTALRWTARRDIPAGARSALYTHDLLGTEGLEFVAFLNAKLLDPVELSGGTMLVPCFLSEAEMTGAATPDLLNATLAMGESNRYVYDGWLPIRDWDPAAVESAVRAIDASLSMFALTTYVTGAWEPKYPARGTMEDSSTYRVEAGHLAELAGLAATLDLAINADREAVLRSVGWLSQAMRLREPAARFLFCVLAIESLATYIEEEAEDDSQLIELRRATSTKSERRRQRDDCIRQMLAEALDIDPSKAVQDAYFECIGGVTRKLREHLGRVLSDREEDLARFFGQAGEEAAAVYKVRNEVAHGTFNTANESERERIRKLASSAETVARTYLRRVFRQAFGSDLSAQGMRAEFALKIGDAVASAPGMLRGPTHMALIYM